MYIQTISINNKQFLPLLAEFAYFALHVLFEILVPSSQPLGARPPLIARWHPDTTTSRWVHIITVLLARARLGTTLSVVCGRPAGVTKTFHQHLLIDPCDAWCLLATGAEEAGIRGVLVQRERDRVEVGLTQNVRAS